MKKFCAILLVLFTIVLIPMNVVSADEEPTMNLNILIDNSDSNKVVVSIPNDSKYASLKPKISVNTNFSTIKVEKNGSSVNYTLKDGIVTFTVDDFDCDYIIFNTSVNNDNPGYVFPKTGVN